MIGDDERTARAAFSGEIIRIFIGSALAILLLAGGVYWLRSLPAGPPASEAGTTVQVELLPSPKPTPFQLSAPTPAPAANSASTSALSQNFAAESPKEAEYETREDTAVSIRRPDEPGTRFTKRSASRQSSELAARFQQALLRHISRFQRYPPAARMAGKQGIVHIVFVLRRDGTVVDAWVQSTSGETLLDHEAVATVYRAAPLPQIPFELPDEIRVMLPVDFALP